MFAGALFSLFGGKLSMKAAGMLGTALVIAAAVAAFFIILDAYGDAKYREGEAHADAAWQAASDELEERADASADAADENETVRVEEFTEELELERERIDEAETHGTSPLDVIFGSAG